MVNRRWWDIATFGAAIVIAVFAFLVYSADPQSRPIIATASVALVVVAYLAFARPEIGAPTSTWRTPAFVAVAAVATALGIAANPFLAMLQTIIYPLIWVITPARRSAIISSGVVAFAVFVGFAVGEGFSVQGLVAGLTTAGFSIVFAIVFGLWIASIAEYSEERGRLLAELTAAQDEVSALSRERGAAAERERFAREIHDTLAQTLAGLVFLAERAGRQSRDGQTEAASETIATVEGVARDALTEARALVARTAAVPSEPVLEAALDRLAARFRAESGIELVVASSGTETELDREAQVVVLRCMQEALANVRKHAAATRVDVRVDVKDDGDVILEVHDDGIGFDPDAAQTGFGLDGMRERLSLAGGVLTISSDPVSGTTLTARLPAIRTAGIAIDASAAAAAVTAADAVADA